MERISLSGVRPWASSKRRICAGIGDPTARPKRAVGQEYCTGAVPLTVVFGAPGVDDLDMWVVQVLGEPCGANQQLSIGVIEFGHGDALLLGSACDRYVGGLYGGTCMVAMTLSHMMEA